MENFQKKQGSTWKKCDLHIHTPFSYNTEYGGDDSLIWERFITELEKLPDEIKIIGINDYLFIDGYKKVLEYKQKNRLKNIDLILPVIEFRIDKYSGNETLKKINYHIIFADNSLLKIEDIQSYFLNYLQINSQVSSEKF